MTDIVMIDVTPTLTVAASYAAGDYVLYMFSGTQAQLTAVGTLATVAPLVAVTDNGVLHYPELGSNVSTAIRTKINAWLTARGLLNIPTGWTNRQLLTAILSRFGMTTEDGNWVTDQ